MVAMHDFFEVDLPGEVVEEPTWEEVYGHLAEPDIIPFPVQRDWEPDPEPPAACALCEEDGADSETGVCRICADRLPKVGGCGLALWLVAGMTSGEAGPALDHLAACPDCRQFFDRLGDLARVADMETSHAESLQAAA